MRVKMSPDSLNPDTIEAVLETAAKYGELSLYDRIRKVHSELSHIKNVKSHISLVFQLQLPKLWQILRDPLYGTRTIGRPPALSRKEEDMVVEYVKEAHLSGRCATFKQVTSWINHELRLGLPKVSRKYVQKNKYINQKIKTFKPQSVEDVGIEGQTRATNARSITRNSLVDKERQPIAHRTLIVKQ
jgi:hypothetical protein